MALMWTTFLTGGPQKVNHAAALVGDHIYSFGGYSVRDYSTLRYLIQPIDVYTLCTVTNRWKKLKTPSDAAELPCVPFQRYGHSAVAHGTNIYIWGGKNDDVTCNRLHCFDTVLQRWSCPKVKGFIPSARDGHTACIIDNKMYIVGGFADESTQYAEGLYALDLNTMRWTLMNAEGEEPTFRDFHSAAAVNGKMYIFGGRGGVNGPYYTREEVYNNDLFIYDPQTNWWTRKQLPNAPPGRRSLGMVPHGDRLYVFGGYNGLQKKYFNDVHYYDTVADEWSGELMTFGTVPCKRRRHCTIIVGDRIFVFGGTSPTDSMYVDMSHEEFYFLEDGLLMDYNDMYILDLKPTLRTLCKVAVVRYNLSLKHLPRTLKREIRWMKTNNKINARRK